MILFEDLIVGKVGNTFEEVYLIQFLNRIGGMDRVHD
jgi:hypothetical protein